MSSNGKSSEGGGGEDADDEDGMNKKAKPGDSNTEISPSSAQKVANINASILSAVPPTAIPPAISVLQSRLQAPAKHPHIPPIVPSQTNPLQTSIPPAQTSALHKPLSTGAQQKANFPPTLSIPSPPQNPTPVISNTNTAQANYYRPPVHPQTNQVVPQHIQHGQPRQQYLPTQHGSQGPSPYSYPHNQQPQNISYRNTVPPSPHSRIESASSVHSPQYHPTGLTRTPIPHHTPHGPNQNLLNPATNHGYTYPAQVQNQLQATATSPQLANQGLLTPQLPSGHVPNQSLYQLQPHQQQLRPTQYPAAAPPPQSLEASSNPYRSAQKGFQYSQGQGQPVGNPRLNYPQQMISPMPGASQPRATNTLPGLPPNAPQGSFFNPAAVAFSQPPQQETIQHPSTSARPVSNQSGSIPNAPAQNSNRMVELQNELLFKKKKELWKYKRKKQKRGDGTGTGTEDSQDSQEDSGSVNSGNESATGSLSSSTSAPLPHLASAVGQQQHSSDIRYPIGPSPMVGASVSTNLPHYPVGHPSNVLSDKNNSTIVNKPSTESFPYGATTLQQSYRHPTPTNLQLRMAPGGTRPNTPSTTVAGWQQQTVAVASSAMNPQMISTANQHRQYLPPGSNYDPGQYPRTYQQPGEMSNNGMPRAPQAYDTYRPSHPDPSYPYQQSHLQQRGAVVHPRQEIINPYQRAPITGAPSSNFSQYQHQNPDSIYQNNGAHAVEASNQPLRYGYNIQQPGYRATRPQNYQHMYGQPPNGSANQPIVAPIKTEPSVTCSEEHTFGLCISCGWCGPPNPNLQSLSNGSKCTKPHGEGLCSECGYVGMSSSNDNSTVSKGEKSKPFVSKYGDLSDIDNSTEEDSDSSDGFNSLNQIRKTIKPGKRSHAELVAALTKKKSGSNVNLARKQPVISQSIHSAGNNVNRVVSGEIPPKTETVAKPPKRPTSLSAVKFHKAHTVDLTREFDELLAELDYMEKTDKMHPTIFRSYGPKGVFDKPSGRVPIGNDVPLGLLVPKKTLSESVKKVTKKLEEEDSDFTASEDEKEESIDSITEEEEEEGEEEESSEDAPILIRRKSVPKKTSEKKNKYEYDSDYSISKEDIKMMKALKKSTARLENPDYESEEESIESAADDEKDEDWSDSKLSDDDIPLRKRKVKDKKISPKHFRPRKIRGEDLSIDMNIDYQVSSESGSRRRFERSKTCKDKKKRRKMIIESDDEDLDSDVPLKRHRKLKSRKCRDESSEDFSASDSEKSSSSSESDIRKKKNITSAERPRKETALDSTKSSNSKEPNSGVDNAGQDHEIESEASKTFDEYEEELQLKPQKMKRCRFSRRHREQGYVNVKFEATDKTNIKPLVARMRFRCRPYLRRTILRVFRKTYKTSNTMKLRTSDWKYANKVPIVRVERLSTDLAIKHNVKVPDQNKPNSEDNASSRSSTPGFLGFSDKDREEDICNTENLKRRARRISDSASDESSLSIGIGMLSDSEDVDFKGTTEGRARRALSFSEMSSSNDTPQRPRSPKRKGVLQGNVVGNVVRSDIDESLSSIPLPKENGHDEGDESERSIQEARSPKRSSKLGSKVNSSNTTVPVTVVEDAVSQSPMLGAKYGTKRGKPEPLTPKKSTIRREEDPALPWLLRENKSASENGTTQILRNAFEKNMFPSLSDLTDLEAATKMPTKKIILWFQQARKAKQKEDKLRELLKREITFMKAHNESNGYDSNSTKSVDRIQKQLSKSSSSQSLYSCGGADSESSGDFRGFDSDTNQGTIRLILNFAAVFIYILRK